MTKIIKNRESHVQEKDFDRLRFSNFLNEVVKSSGKPFDENQVNSMEESLVRKISDKEEVEAWKLFDLIITEANGRIDKSYPEYTYISASAMLRKLYKRASKERGFDYRQGYGDYLTLVRMMTHKGLYSDDIIKSYTEEEIKEAGTYVDIEKDKLFSYAGLFLLNKNYLFTDYNGNTLELPQERFLTTAMYLMKDENKEKRMEYVKEAYWVMSNHYVGLATPTLMNSGKPLGTLSSCHILTMDDSLKSIMDVEKDISTFAQNGAGIGVYMGFLRANGSWIRGFKGRSSGVVKPCGKLSKLAEYVDQLG